MAPKRRVSTTNENSHPSKQKRAKFTLDSVRLPETKKTGVVLSVGSNDVGQLGLGPDVPEKSRLALVDIKHEIVDVCAGGMHTVCLSKEGKVYTFGCNDEGALGRITEDKEDSEFSPEEVELPAKVIQISAGDSHTAALLEDGRVFAWGTFRDSHGNMGLTLNGNEKVPYEIMNKEPIAKIASGENHIVFLTKHGVVYTCGCGEQGQLGRTSERNSGRDGRGGMGPVQREKLLTPHPIFTKSSLKLHFDDIWAGNNGTYVKVANKDDIYVFGLNNYAQLGLNKFGQQYLPVLSKEFSSHKWKMICGALHHTIALDQNGTTYAIGRREYGRLGLGDIETDAQTLTEIPTLKNKGIVLIGVGSCTSFAVSTKGELFSWGMGTSGQLGTGEDEDCLTPTLIKSKQVENRHVFKVSSGGQHTVILATTSNNNEGDTNSI